MTVSGRQPYTVNKIRSRTGPPLPVTVGVGVKLKPRHVPGAGSDPDLQTS